jgi:uncharacterized protein YaaN involved in tellurite resistance
MSDPGTPDTTTTEAPEQAGTTPDATSAGAAGAATAQLVLQPPQPVQAVAPQQASTLVDVDPATEQKLDATVESYVDALTTLSPTSPEFLKKTDSIHTMGDDEIRQAASVSNRMLDRPVAAMDTGLFDSKSPVSKSLLDLRKTIDDLDPTKQGLFSKKHLFGLIPFGDHIRDYFMKYESAQTHINGILQALYRGQDELQQDNAAVEQEKVNLWQIMGRLKQYAYMADKLDQALEAKINGIEANDPERAKALREDALFYVRQKHQDLLTQLAVSAQGYLALDMIRKNNIELIKGVDRATTTTVSALRTAVMVAQALANQKLVLDQITALNSTTGNLIESTSEMLRDTSGKVHEEAASSTIDVSKLQAAFQNIYATMDAIDTYKLQALDTMRQTVQALETEVQKAQEYLDRSQRSEQTAAQAQSQGGDLSLPPTSGA